MRNILTALAFGISAVAASAQDAPPPEFELVGGSVKSNFAIAVPALPSPSNEAVGRQISEVIASDLRSTGLFTHDHYPGSNPDIG